MCTAAGVSALTRYSELGTRDVRPTDHPVVALVGRLAFLDFQLVVVATDANVVLVTGVQFLGAFVPGQIDLWIVDLDLTLKYCFFFGEGSLVRDVLHHGDRLTEGEENYISECF